MGKGSRDSLAQIPLSASEWEALERGEELAEERVSFPTPADVPDGPINLWMDDLRTPEKCMDVAADEWYWAKNGTIALGVLQTGRVQVASLDHDLGEELNGYDVVVHMRAHNFWPQQAIRVHSDNAAGSAAMVATIAADGFYGRQLGRSFRQ